MKNRCNQHNNYEMSNEMLEEFYNYKYWRETQKKQLTISSNIFFTFNVATIGFIINYLIKNKFFNIIVVNLFKVSLLFLVLSVIVYVIFNILRLHDYRKTARLIKRRKTFSFISSDTKCIGKINWFLFYCQVGLSIVGMLATLFTFYQVIF